MGLTFEEFKRVDLRIARVESCEPHPNADKLLVLQIRIGEERRQIVAGIRLAYRPEDLVGRKIVVVTNLDPVRLRGVESRGMLLAAVDGDTISVLQPDKDVADGVPVT